MTINRIVSFLPSATELLYELEVQDKLFGVTHECSYPTDAKNKPRVIDTVIKSDELTSSEINNTTCRLLSEGKDIFILDESNLKKANPDLIISQETCEVCAAYTNQVNKAIQILEKKPKVYSMDPHNVDEIIKSVLELGKFLDKKEKAIQITDALKRKIENVKNKVSDKKPKILAIEWIEPFFTAGHWVPEMIQIAGGINMISKTGEHSRKISIDEIIKSDPEIIIMMPCGFDVKRTITEYEKILKKNKKWMKLRAVKNNNIFAVNANAFFSKPSIRTIEGIEIIAKIINPEKFEKTIVSKKAFEKIEVK